MCCYDKMFVNVSEYIVIPGYVCVWCGVNRNFNNSIIHNFS